MNRREALRALGLDEDASMEDIKTAYKETVQILHPDRFAKNKKLQDRATEQFKNLQDAYEFLTKGKASRGSSSRGRASSSSSAHPRASSSRGYTEEDELRARLSGITAAKTQLVAQRDAAYGARRNGFAVAAAGALVVLVFGRKLGIFAAVAGIGATAAVWGVVHAVSAQREISMLSERIEELNAEKKRLMQQLEEEEW